MGYHVIAAAVGNATLVSTRSGEVNAIVVIGGATISYVQFFDAASVAAVTLGTTVPDHVVGPTAIGVPMESLVGTQVVFKNGIVVGSTTTATGSSTLAASVRVWIG